jgi:hypothetical protein
MSDYRERKTGEIKSQGEWRRHFSNMSLPNAWNSDIENTLNLDPVHYEFAPKTDKYKVAVIDGAEKNSDGQWVTKWTIVDMFKEYTDEDGNTVTVEQQIKNEEARELEIITEAARERRNHFLELTDWWSVSDLTMTAEQKTYRQTLRDLPTHSNWPHLKEDDWPSKEQIKLLSKKT